MRRRGPPAERRRLHWSLKLSCALTPLGSSDADSVANVEHVRGRAPEVDVVLQHVRDDLVEPLPGRDPGGAASIFAPPQAARRPAGPPATPGSPGAAPVASLGPAAAVIGTALPPVQTCGTRQCASPPDRLEFAPAPLCVVELAELVHVIASSALVAEVVVCLVSWRPSTLMMCSRMHVMTS